MPLETSIQAFVQKNDKDSKYERTPKEKATPSVVTPKIVSSEKISTGDTF